MFSQIAEQLIERIDLNKQQINTLVEYLLNPAVNPVQKSALLVLLKAKGESAAEMVNFIREFKQRMQSITICKPVLDIVGTGGDGLNTINLSTGAALLAASCGVPVAKHGNRAVSSHCGSADLLEAIGIPIDLPKKCLISSIEQHQFGFCFAPLFHPLLQDLKALRCALGIPTVLNLLAPFLNPANAQHYVLGVRSNKLLTQFAEVLLQLNIKHAVVLHTVLPNGQAMDEGSTVGVMQIAEVSNSSIRYYTLCPEELNLPYADLVALQGHSVAENAQKLLAAFQGIDGIVADNLALNAAMGLYVYGHAASITEAFTLAKATLKSGKVMNLVQQLQARK